MFEGILRESFSNPGVVKFMDLNDQDNGSGIVILQFG